MVRESSHIYVPRNLGELLAIRKIRPDALLFAGGTYILKDNQEKVPELPRHIIYLMDIDELKRVSRTERYLEIGAAVSINRILHVGKHLLPRALWDALKGIGPPALLNQATLGGNLCVRKERMSAYHVLLLMDVKIELRRTGSSRWIPLQRFIDLEPLIENGEVVTRIRIPFTSWDFQIYRRLQDGKDGLTYCALASRQKEVLSAFTFSFGALGPHVIRSREVESALLGRKLPLTERDKQQALLGLRQTVERSHRDFSSFRKDRILSIFSSTLDMLIPE
ncbi:MAG: FAD binding domain-containing protein [Spirochaetales bacterium]|nr:FAD binding domain-containing protein [Spirochaetales bacterium]